MEDLISRKAAIDEITEYGSGDIIYMSVVELKRRIEHLPPAQAEERTEERTETHACDCISRQAAIMQAKNIRYDADIRADKAIDDVIYALEQLPSAQPDIAEKLYQYKCYITDKVGLTHEVVHTGDIRRVTGWEI